MKPVLVFFGLLIGLITSISINSYKNQEVTESRVLSYEVDVNKQDLRFYWKNSNGKNYGNFQNLKSEIEKDKRELVFAMNGGMYMKDFSPQGLYIENGEIKRNINKVKEGYGNFYLQPNGIFLITKNNKPEILVTDALINTDNIKYATQSGPMLLINGKIHPKFTEGSTNVHIRNGVGVLPSGNLLFAMSKKKINFYDFACFFKEKGCLNALYLDGFVSRAYVPSKKWEQIDGNLGVIIGVTRPIQ